MKAQASITSADALNLAYLELGIKALSGALIPIILVFIGLEVRRYLQKAEQDSLFRRDIVQKRFESYEEIANHCNDIFCFVTYRGDWRSINPISVVEKKRRCDSLLFSSSVLWTDELIRSYQKFMNSCFETKRGRLVGANIKTNINRHKERPEYEWNPEEERAIVTEEEFTVAKNEIADVMGIDIGGMSFRSDVVIPAYADFLAVLSESLGGKMSPEALIEILE